MIRIEESIVINTTPKELWSFLISLDKDNKFKKWHPKDHIRIRFLRGKMDSVKTIVYFEEYLGKKRFRFACRVTKVVHQKHIAFQALFPISALKFGRGYFDIKRSGKKTKLVIFIEYGHRRVKVSNVVVWFAEKFIVQKNDIELHIKEELEILKHFLEEDTLLPFSKSAKKIHDQKILHKTDQ